MNLWTLSGTSPSCMTFCAASTTCASSIALEASSTSASNSLVCRSALATIAAESGAGCRSSPSACSREPATRLRSVSESCLVTASTRWMQLEARLSLARSAGKEAGAISSGIGIAGGAGGGIGCATAIACIRDGCCSSALEYDEDAPASLLLPGDLLSLSYIRSSIEAGRPLDPLPELDEPSPEGVPSSSFRSAPMASRAYFLP